MESVVSVHSQSSAGILAPAFLPPPDALPVRTEPGPQFWESLVSGWPQNPFSHGLSAAVVALLTEIQRKTGQTTGEILDCGSGTGNPGIGLALAGVPVWAVDSDPLMLEQFQKNYQRAGAHGITVVGRDWTEMDEDPRLRNRHFPLVMCRGNALIYVRSWDRELLDAPAALAAAREALFQMYQRVAEGGCLYVDITSDSEFQGGTPLPWSLAPARTNEGDWLLGHWIPEHDTRLGVRRLHACRVRRGAGGEAREILTYRFSGLLLQRQELERLLQEAGFDRIERRRIDPASPYEELLAWR